MATILPELAKIMVRRLSGQSLGHFTLSPGQTILCLKKAIAEAGGPLPSDQQLIAGHDVLQDDKEAIQALAEKELVFCLTVPSCPTCRGPCACRLCGTKPQFGLIDYYGTCSDCGRCGGHVSLCPFCNQGYPSLCALDTHVMFTHPDKMSGGEWHNHRLEEHIKKRKEPGAKRAAMPVPGTFTQVLTGGLEAPVREAWEPAPEGAVVAVAAVAAVLAAQGPPVPRLPLTEEAPLEAALA